MKKEPEKSATASMEASGEKERPQFVIEKIDFEIVFELSRL